MNGENKTPTQFAPNLSKELGVDLFVKRDDLYPMYGGGNKARKMRSIYQDIVQCKADVIITNGGSESNHARVCALLAATKGMECHLVLHGEKPDTAFCNGNGFLMEFAGAQIDYCDANQIADLIERRRTEYERAGKGVYVVPGGAHSVQGALAYAEAIEELDFQPDYIVVASGTGATHAGLHVGAARRFGSATSVVGISVARNRQRGEQVVFESIVELEEFLGISGSTPNLVFRDEWIAGGYGKYSERIISAIKFALIQEGLILDPIYTGKAFLGLCDMVMSGEIGPGRSIVFWHTGGQLNLQSTARFQ